MKNIIILYFYKIENKIIIIEQKIDIVITALDKKKPKKNLIDGP